MAKQMGKRIYRQATREEQERHSRVREQIQEELADIKKRARQKLAEFVILTSLSSFVIKYDDRYGK